MSESGPPAGDVFDLERIRRLIELMEQHDLHEIQLRQGEQQIQLTRGGQAAAAAGPAAAPAAAAPAPAAATSPPAAAPEQDGRYVYIESPMVGTFYSRPNPESEAFVKVGDRVHAETTVCIIEAMKVFNEIPAGCSGAVAAVLVDDEAPVDFGKKLFKIDTQQ